MLRILRYRYEVSGGTLGRTPRGLRDLILLPFSGKCTSPGARPRPRWRRARGGRAAGRGPRGTGERHLPWSWSHVADDEIAWGRPSSCQCLGSVESGIHECVASVRQWPVTGVTRCSYTIKSNTSIPGSPTSERPENGRASRAYQKLRANCPRFGWGVCSRHAYPRLCLASGSAPPALRLTGAGAITYIHPRPAALTR